MDPPVSFYDEIKQLGHLYHVAQNQYLMSQLVNYGLTIIKSTNDYETRIQTWIESPVIKLTWPNFKVYFEEDHCILRETRATKMRTITYHHTKISASQVLIEVKSVHNNVLQVITTHMS